MTREFDVVVIGAGVAGEVIAGRLAEKGGRRVAIVEKHLVGGECSFYACMPSKALLRPQEVLSEAARVPGVAEVVARELDVAAVLRRRHAVVGGLDDRHQLPWLWQRNIELFRGHGRRRRRPASPSPAGGAHGLERPAARLFVARRSLAADQIARGVYAECPRTGSRPRGRGTARPGPWSRGRSRSWWAP